MFRFLQNHPHFLEQVYDGMERGIRPFARWLKPNGRLQPLMIFAEKAGKGAVFDCRMCGPCILHSTGMTYPMTCPQKPHDRP